MHRYSTHGEKGLMIIGSIDELVGLGQALAEAATASAKAPVATTMWPPKVTEFKPHSQGGDFKVSFHVDTTGKETPETNFPDKKSVSWFSRKS
jgi:hypothetical protein